MLPVGIYSSPQMTAFRGELTSHHPHFHPASPAACKDIDIKTAKELYPNGMTVGIHMGQSRFFLKSPVLVTNILYRFMAPTR